LNHPPYHPNKALPHHAFITNGNGRTTPVNATHLKSLISTSYASVSHALLKPFYHFFGSAPERSPCVIPQRPETRKSSRQAGFSYSGTFFFYFRKTLQQTDIQSIAHTQLFASVPRYEFEANHNKDYSVVKTIKPIAPSGGLLFWYSAG
jgi:hypothetical protein